MSTDPMKNDDSSRQPEDPRTTPQESSATSPVDDHSEDSTAHKTDGTGSASQHTNIAGAPQSRIPYPRINKAPTTLATPRISRTLRLRQGMSGYNRAILRRVHRRLQTPMRIRTLYPDIRDMQFRAQSHTRTLHIRQTRTMRLSANVR